MPHLPVLVSFCLYYEGVSEKIGEDLRYIWKTSCGSEYEALMQIGTVCVNFIPDRIGHDLRRDLLDLMII